MFKPSHSTVETLTTVLTIHTWYLTHVRELVSPSDVANTAIITLSRTSSTQQYSPQVPYGELERISYL